MKLIKLAAAVAALSASTAFAAPAFTIPGGTVLDPFGGIDWVGNGTAYTTNFNQAAANAGGSFNFTTTFFAYANPASGIQRPDGTQFIVPNLQGGQAPSGANAFELTTVATINETGTCAAGGTSCTFSITGGSFDIYLDTNVDSRTGAAAALSQYTNGTRIIGGTIDSGSSSFAATNATGGSGRVDLRGTVNSTNGAFINPALSGTTAVATLQIGSSTTNYTRPGFVGADNCATTGAGSAPTSCTLAFQADANQSFTFAPVPAPGTLALLGAAMAGLGFTARRRAAR